ncbi:MAG: hypothetical protein U9Q69_02250 [Nanoarchaeota archaeon]|nr:hypothetical protein [Nanoarchaeota archaeon]
MSCGIEKIMEFYGANPKRTAALIQAKNYLADNTMPKAYDKIFKPNYGGMRQFKASNYQKRQRSINSYIFAFKPSKYDIGPAKWIRDEGISIEGQINENEHVSEPNINMLEDMILKAKEQEQWMQIMQ